MTQPRRILLDMAAPHVWAPAWFGIALFEALRPLTGEESVVPHIARDYGFTISPGDTLTIKGIGTLTYEP